MDDDRKRVAADEIAAELGSRRPLYGGSRERKQIVELPLERVRSDPNQPRQLMDKEALEELAQSIREHGLLQPISVRLDPNDHDVQNYVIVAGERRYRAHVSLGRERIEAIILRDLDEQGAYEIALIENLQREDLSPIEEAVGYRRLIEEFGYTQEKVADRVGRARASVSKALKLNQLPERIHTEFNQLPTGQRVGKSTLIEIASADGEREQLALWQRAKRGATVRAVREVRQEKPGKTPRQLKAGAQKRRLTETCTYGQEFVKEFAKRLNKMTVQMLSAHREEATELYKLAEGLVAAAAELRSKLEAIQARNEESQTPEAAE